MEQAAAAGPDQAPSVPGTDGAPARAIAGVAADAAAALARELAAQSPRLDPSLLVNRELSLLAFQWRVFEEVRDPTNPLLERVRFLSIVASNLDEFFMIRVAGIEQQVAAGFAEPSADGLTPAQQLAEVRREALRLTRSLGACWQGELLPLLDAAGIHVLDHPQLDPKQAAHARSYFDEMVMPVLTPLAFDPGRPFPHISNLSLNLAVLVEDEGVERFARVKVPDTLPRLVPIGRATGGLASPRGPAPASRVRLARAAGGSERRPALPRRAGEGGVPVPRHPRRGDGAAGDGGRGPARVRRARRPRPSLRLGRPSRRDAEHAGPRPSPPRPEPRDRDAGRARGRGAARALGGRRARGDRAERFSGSRRSSRPSPPAWREGRRISSPPSAGRTC